MKPTSSQGPRQEPHPAPEMLSAFREGKLKGAELSTVAEHIKSCRSCRTNVGLGARLGEHPAEDSFSNQALSTRVTVPPTLDRLEKRAGAITGPAGPEDAQRSTQSPESDPAQSGMPMRDSVADLPPELANHPRFRILRELGRGGMGAVYLAEHRLMERWVAVKVINKSQLDRSDALPRFLSEIKAAAQLNHENIVRAYDAEEAGNFHMLIMEYVEGMSLDRLVQRKGLCPSLTRATTFAKLLWGCSTPVTRA
jgi:eukaryotic-like serine/threonine-protein kinase